MKYSIGLKNNRCSHLIFIIGYFLLSYTAIAQVTSAIDTTTITLGEQITYHIQIEADTTDLVIFPERNTFLPLEVIDEGQIDTLLKEDAYRLLKTYALTQFDSGRYTIPRQKVIINDKTFFTDSLQVEVNNVKVDTTKQKLYKEKAIFQVDNPSSNIWKIIVLILGVLGIIGGLLYWFIWRKKPITEEEKIALLPAYDRAKLALKKLDDTNYLEHENLKDYYSELTFIIRKYLDEKVYDHALESTTDELIKQLNILKKGRKIALNDDDIINIEQILKRADLVKFAKSAPDIQLAKIDRDTIASEIDHVKQALPEPTEEEKLLNETYRKEQERKKSNKKIIRTIAAALCLLLLVFVGFSIKYGLRYVKDSVIGHESKTLLEGEWVTSDYGTPAIGITTPQVLNRVEMPIPEEQKAMLKTAMFMYGTLLGDFSVNVSTIVNTQGSYDLDNVIEGALKGMVSMGAKNITDDTEDFTSSNDVEGKKTYGTLQVDKLKNGTIKEVNYIILHFVNDNILQQVMLSYPQNDTYAERIVERILNSVEPKKEN